MNKCKRILALLGVLLLLGLYGSTLVFALLDHPNAGGMLMASIYSTIVVPVFCYAVLLVAKTVRGKGTSEETQENPTHATGKTAKKESDD
ncbi:MAG: hypothetical protein Q4B85_00450 [Lachnospiraceae bacterium]|nr:hypothetical protein [Lachnospiraceae bacterium]